MEITLHTFDTDLCNPLKGILHKVFDPVFQASFSNENIMNFLR